MAVFDAYAASYDLLYQDKDYAGETSFVLERLRDEVPRVAEVLELGCGTGAHAALFARQGVGVHGIDFSAAMLVRAEARRDALAVPEARRLSYSMGDVRDFRSDRRFDAVISLFHVMTYQTTDDALVAALRTAAHHLRPGGVFLFDFWWGPAVRADPPVTRTKQVENAQFKVTRVAQPSVHEERNLVEVSYHVTTERRFDGQVEAFDESHSLRYWFLPELQRHVAAAGLEFVSAAKWLTREPADETCWLAYLVTRKPSTSIPG